MALKTIRILYSSREFTTGLANVKAQIYVNEVPKAVGGSALTLSELDATNAPGIYYVDIAASTLTGWGAVVGDTVEAVINSATKPAPAAYKEKISDLTFEDINTHLGTQDTEIASIKSTGLDSNTKITAVKGDLETGPNSLASIMSAIASVQSAVGSIQNNVSFSADIPDDLVVPTSGSKTYRIPVRIFNAQGQMADPDSQSILVSLKNVSGTDRGAMLTGYSGGTAPAVRDALGVYHIDLVVASTAVIEELLFEFVYAVSSSPFNQSRAATLETDVSASGFALETTAQSVLTQTTDIQTKINSASYGLAAAKAVQDAIKVQTDKIGDGTIGLAAANTLQLAIQTAVGNALTDLGLVKGTGFATGTDSLKALSDRVYSGGMAV
jgi:hypothetical protein